ncbi:putative cytochrome p450 [Diaporthe ampelina]|uniref:Putative cytochrome p450 n=1 Tax=Diaporthe ampelina TaxID=1214573 RepID=A0A0G2F3F5_9PEZI|nr:putative cytochrome p450 [Diaporthe ampelina]
MLYVGYRAALPKPLPGIPYNHGAAGKLFGDVPEMMSYVRRTKRIFVRVSMAVVSGHWRTSSIVIVLTPHQCWLTSLTDRHDSPIVQAFIKPFSLPWVVITDPFESQDILLRRTREFDRAPFFGEIVGGLLPRQHSHFLSTDGQFRRNRALVNHLMAPTFIREVSAPEMHGAAEGMIRVWGVKCDRAAGRAFSAHHDLTYLALDAILAAVFGLAKEENITAQRLREVQNCTPPGLDSPTKDSGEPVPFPETEGVVPPISAAIITLSMSLTENQLSPAPALTAWVMRKLPYMRRAIAIKDEYVRRKVDECIPLIEAAGDTPSTTQPRSALHSVLLRERDTASKEGRKPQYHSRAIADEFIGFMMAGHDTTATTMAWSVKLLADSPGPQARLRAELRAALPAAAAGRRAPSYAELAGAHVPYLDATVEEVLRHANSIAFVVRRAMCDAPVLGRVVPRDTNVFLMANGAGYLTPNRPVEPDALRGPGARRGVASNARALTGVWDDGDIGVFRPERWLRATEEGTAFDPMAGPSLPFGAGPRGCFGKRLALQALRIQIALVVWHFELRRCPAELSGYNAVQRFAREPTQCYVRLARVVW